MTAKKWDAETFKSWGLPPLRDHTHSTALWIEFVADTDLVDGKVCSRSSVTHVHIVTSVSPLRMYKGSLMALDERNV